VDWYELVSYLYLNRNRFNGIVPTGLAQLSGLFSLNLNDNLFYQQPLPSFLVSVIELARNKFTGSLPSYESETDAFFIDFGGNSLSGTIPFNFGSLAGLTFLYLNNNLWALFPRLLPRRRRWLK
jgi:hypothetical protein